MKMPASLQGRLLALVLAASLAVWLGAAALSWRDAQHELDELLDSHLAQAAALLVARQAHGDTDDERLDAPSLHRYAPRVLFQVFHEGRLALRSAQAPTEPIVGGAGALQGFHTVTLQGERWRVFAARGAEQDVQVFVAEKESSRASILGAVLRSTLWPVAVALPLLALAGWWAVRLGLRPLREAAGSLARRDPADLRAIEDGGAPTELRTLLGALNSLFARIAALLERERRFTGDAAHELRTPLAAVRAQAQVALGAQDEAQRRHALQATLAGCDRATRVVEQLLTLSRLESGTAMPLARVDLAQVVRGVVAQLAPAGLDRRQSIAFDADAGCAVEGDETLLAVLARNALDNAIRYSPHGARIEVAVRREGQDVVLSVEDSGPGLPQDQLRRLGERFFRAAGQAESGSGLGWSILQRIAAAHRGSVHAAASAALGGLAVQARFPAAARPA
ncbi:MAG: sensor histidine kinase N-terminal domain-containing protein [Burkholderiales bacterium]|nr:sensor histidine kinase N-terminal domain-containing protein [Burkholderiales bacterium]